jgi:hypothetical protein
MEAIGEVKTESGDDYQDQHYVIAHEISVPTSDLVVDSRKNGQSNVTN